MMLLSSCAIAAMIANIASPIGAEVSSASWCEMKSTSQGPLLQSQDQLFHTPGEAVETKDYDHLEGSAPGVGHERIQARAPLGRIADPVPEDLVKRLSALSDQILERLLLHSGILIVAHTVALAGFCGRGDSDVDASALRRTSNNPLIHCRRSPSWRCGAGGLAQRTGNHRFAVRL
jgi:hypothetical protein